MLPNLQTLAQILDFVKIKLNKKSPLLDGLYTQPNCHLNQYDTERKVGFKLCIDLLVAYGLFRRMFKKLPPTELKRINSFYFSEMLHLKYHFSALVHNF
jgi:hypothetical protein